MSDFFEKLKKGMGAEEELTQKEINGDNSDEPVEESPLPDETDIEPTEEIQEVKEEIKEEVLEEKPIVKKVSRPKKVKKQIVKTEMEKTVPQKPTKEEEIKTSLKIETEKEEKKPKTKKEKKWFSLGGEEGQLTVDMYQTENDLVIQTAVAGIKPEDLDITIERDVITLRGSREKQHQEEGADYFIQECFWGAFSRQIILPVEVAPNQAKASFKENVLTIRIPKVQREKKMKINISA